MSRTHEQHHRHKEMNEHRADPTVLTWVKAARSFTVKDLLQQRSRQFSGGIITVPHDASLQLALDTLQTNGIISAPVFRHKELLGTVDVLDIAAYALDFWKTKVSRNEWRGYSYSTTEFFKTGVTEVLNYSKMDLPFVLTERTSIADAIRMFGEPRKVRPHRSLVLNDLGEIVGIVSQSDLVYFVQCTRNQMPPLLLTRTLRSLNQVTGCVSVRLDNAFADTLELLYQNKVSAVPLMDDQYRICGNFSASDLRGISPKSFDFFEGSTIQFLTKCTKSGMGSPLWAGEDAPLEEALNLLVNNKVHRIYITNAHGLPTGVFSLTDALEIFSYLVAHSE